MTKTKTELLEVTYGIKRIDGCFDKLRTVVVPIDRIDEVCGSLELDGYTIFDVFAL